MAVQLGIEDFAYFIFCFAVQFYWQGGGLFSVREGVREGGFEFGDMENGVYPSELLWEADCNGVHAQCKRANWALGLWNALHYSVSKGVIQRK